MRRSLLLVSALVVIIVVWGTTLVRDSRWRKWIATAPRSEVEAYVTAHPDQPDALLRLTTLLRNAGEWEAAEGRTRHAVEVAPNEERCWVEYSRTIRDDKEVIRGLEGFLKIQPESASIRAEAARHYLLTGDMSTAQTLIDKALQLSPESSSAYRIQGDLMTALRQLPDAEKAYRKSLALQDDNETRLALSRTLIPLQRYEEIAGLCAPIIRAGSSPELSQEQRAQALIYTAGGRLYSPLTSQEIEILQSQLREAGTLSNALRAEERFLSPYFLGESFLRLGKPKEAIEPLERSVRLNPMFPGSLFSLSRAYRLAGETKKAETATAQHTRISRLLGELEMYSNRLTQKPDDAEAVLRLAGTFEELGNKGEAVSLYQRLVSQGKYVDLAQKRLKALSP
ncbi:hypothetical protein LBMAG21_06720 [Armatimonadota bacterium]|nr:hypothetical protein LBMAG21_06720 [Armatimonadota bacterium]